MIALLALAVAATAAGADERERFAAAVLASTTVEWSAEFQRRGEVYAPPRPIFLDPPRGHPGRGFGYFRGVGVDLDLGEMVDLRAVLHADGDVVTAFMIAHEVAHHVQFLVERRGGPRLPDGTARELEADCAAGWWLARARARASPRRPLFGTANLAQVLPRALDVLYVLNRSHLGVRDAVDDAAHGAIVDRLAAIDRGQTAVAVADCGAGLGR